MDIRQFERRLLAVILLLVGLFIFNMTVPLLIPLTGMGESLISVIRHSSWIGRLIFGIILVVLTKRSKTLSISIGILATMMPVFGGLFYLLTSIDNKNKS